MNNKNLQITTLGGGCFWCTEAVFQEIKGVEKVISGYSGGTAPGHPTYREICSGLTGHAEVIQVTFMLILFLSKIYCLFSLLTHNPTTLNRQGADVGTQYRSVIFYNNDEQKKVAEQVIKDVSTYYEDSIVTEISPLDVFYEAEKEHQNYYRNNKKQGYCSFVITPKLAKLRELHTNKLK